MPSSRMRVGVMRGITSIIRGTERGRRLTMQVRAYVCACVYAGRCYEGYYLQNKICFITHHNLSIIPSAIYRTIYTIHTYADHTQHDLPTSILPLIGNVLVGEFVEGVCVDGTMSYEVRVCVIG